MKRKPVLIFAFLLLLSVLGCKTKSELRREQEFERLKEDVKEFKGSKADIEVSNEELKTDIGRLTNAVDEQGQLLHKQIDDMKKDDAALSSKVQQLEQRIVAMEQRASSDDTAAKQVVAEKTRGSYELGKKLFDDSKFEEAEDTLRNVIHNRPHSEEARKSQFLLADAYFSSKDFASAALEYSNYQKSFPKDSLVPNAIYRQAQAFRSMTKMKEARLFYQELVERFPRNPLAAKAKQEMKHLR